MGWSCTGFGIGITIVRHRPVQCPSAKVDTVADGSGPTAQMLRGPTVAVLTGDTGIDTWRQERPLKRAANPPANAQASDRLNTAADWITVRPGIRNERQWPSFHCNAEPTLFRSMNVHAYDLESAATAVPSESANWSGGSSPFHEWPSQRAISNGEAMQSWPKPTVAQASLGLVAVIASTAPSSHLGYTLTIRQPGVVEWSDAPAIGAPAARANAAIAAIMMTLPRPRRMITPLYGSRPVLEYRREGLRGANLTGGPKIAGPWDEPHRV